MELPVARSHYQAVDKISETLSAARGAREPSALLTPSQSSPRATFTWLSVTCGSHAVPKECE